MRNAGHIRQRTPGSWEIRYSLGADAATGRRRTATMTVKGSRRDAERELRRVLRCLDLGEHVDPSRITVRQWLGTWLEAIRDEISPKSHERYSEIARNFLIPELGAMAVAKLAPMHIQTAYSKWAVSGRRDRKAGGLSPATRKYIHRVLRSSLNRAVEQRLIHQNPADAFRNRLPKVERKDMQTLSAQQATSLLTGLEGTTLHVPVLLALATGARRGEVLALRWCDVDFDRGSLSVTRSLEQTKAGLRFKSPKTERTRAISMPGFLVRALRSAMKRQAETMLALGIRQTGDTLVCCRPDGAATQPRSLTHAFTRVIAEHHDIPRVRFHDLRHSHATLLLVAGVHPKVAQERLGHSTIATTLDLYSHVTGTMQREAAERLDAAFENAISAAHD